MGCFCSKGVWANDSEKHVFGTSTWDDVVLDLDNNNNVLITQFNEIDLAVSCLTLRQSGDKKLVEKYDLKEKQVLVGFEEKHPLEQEEILIFIYTMWNDLQQDSSVIEALKDTKFVKSVDGEAHKPTDMFDPCDALLLSLFSDEANKFPGERFISDGWLNILRKIGLQNTRDADILLKCARKVEFLGAESMSNTKNEVSLEIISLAETLMIAIFRNFEVFNGNNLFQILGKIACVPAERWFALERGKKGVKRVLCSYSEAILLKDWSLAWCAAPILSRENLVPPEYSWEALQLRSPPPFTIVLKHLQVLEYLDKIWVTLSTSANLILFYSDLLKLGNVAFIPVANVTYRANCKFLLSHLTIDLSPLAFELPSNYLPFVKILKELGLHDTLSISSAMMFLLNFEESCHNQRLNPNELRAVIEILQFIYNETIEQQKSDRSNWESKLVVPDDACRLTLSKSCVYIDPYGCHYMKYIDSSKLRACFCPLYFQCLSLFFATIGLSDSLILQELDPVEHLQTLEWIGSVSLASIRLKLLSRSFQVAVFRVINNISGFPRLSKYLDFPTLQRSLECVAQRLQFVQCIYSQFWLLPMSLNITCTSEDSILPEWESGSSHRALYYVDRSNTCILIAEPPSYVSLIDLVAIVVSHVLGSSVPLPIGSLIQCPQDSETAIVDILKISSDEKMMDIVDCGTGFLGRDILPEDARKVQLKPTRPFYKGEIVAWQIHNGEKLKYGRITEDVRPSAWQTLYRVNLETSPGKTRSIISSHIFWFGNFSIGSKASTFMMSEVTSICGKQPFNSGRLEWRNQRQSPKELEHGRVSAHELAQVIEEMLSGAGIRIDTGKQYLLKATLSLQERLEESQVALVLKQEKLEIATIEAKTAEAALLCQICLANEIDITVAPCGHVLCQRCSSAVSHCPFCRVQLSTSIKISS
ncbi:Histidine kinase-like ATPase, ATP-binding domain-containing protein [Artemisia annua]|uniref:Histidine kinase-like ATPase, ATP-binding domain-containing protein n=1 Tax=Artemisia annua TaxID=35608 RepID=A0A2U1P9L6_ARTAN|nr:Histidine kinase-like ATPase, ATP-binding domain-containing protein [Artemisia annua]